MKIIDVHTTREFNFAEQKDEMIITISYEDGSQERVQFFGPFTKEIVAAAFTNAAAMLNA